MNGMMTSGRQKDMARKPVSAFLWWCLPIMLGAASGLARLTFREQAEVWAAAFAWMAAGCFLNALRCHRLHCYVSGPVFLAGAIAAGVLAAGVTHFAPNALSYDIAITLVLVAMSFIPESSGRKYL